MKSSIEEEERAMRVNRNVISIVPLGDVSEIRAYWRSRTPEERLRHLEMLRRMNYGHKATGRLSRVLTIVERSWS